MIIRETKIEGVHLIENKLFEDSRGKFIKPFQKNLFIEKEIFFDIEENFFSISAKGVIRGLHFQTPPFTQAKLVYVPKGKILDVLIDLRIKSPTYKKFLTVELSAENNLAIFIPKGCAHGFQSLENESITVYLQSNIYESSADNGINPLSIDVEWPIKDYIISQKDKNFKDIDQFESPF